MLIAVTLCCSRGCQALLELATVWRMRPLPGMLRCVCACMQADLLGVMVWWNIQLNAVSLVNLVMVRIPSLSYD